MSDNTFQFRRTHRSGDSVCYEGNITLPDGSKTLSIVKGPGLHDDDLKVFQKMGNEFKQLVSALFQIEQICALEAENGRLQIWKCHSAVWYEIEPQIEIILNRAFQTSLA